MQFQIPQFIEVEDKIVGPLTLKQFLYIAIAAAFSFIFFFILQSWLWIIITLILAVAALAAAFVKYNGQPLPRMALRAFNFFWKPRLYLWQRESEFREIEVKGKKFQLSDQTPNLKKLWSDLMTTKLPIPKREKILNIPFGQNRSKERFEIFRKRTGEKEIARRIDYR